ncbi:MAG: OmpA family protein [Roseovarius sp.]
MKHLLATAGLIAMAACSSTPGEVFRSYGEAGSLTDNGDFGNSVMNNTLVMTGEAGFVHSLGNRFAGEVQTTVNFAFGSSALDAGARDTLNEQARWIRQFPEVRFKVYGHTDKVGSNASNKRLGQRRANAVVAYLATQGISRKRLEAVVSFGETQPLIATPNRERRNRRTVTEVTGFVQSHPVVMDGRYAEVVYRETILSAEPRSQLSTVTEDETIVSGE